MKNLIILPTFDIEEDEVALKQFEQLLGGKNIVSIDSNDIAKNGGILNCISWNIQN